MSIKDTVDWSKLDVDELGDEGQISLTGLSSSLFLQRFLLDKIILLVIIVSSCLSLSSESASLVLLWAAFLVKHDLIVLSAW